MFLILTVNLIILVSATSGQNRYHLSFCYSCALPLYDLNNSTNTKKFKFTATKQMSVFQKWSTWLEKGKMRGNRKLILHGSSELSFVVMGNWPDIDARSWGYPREAIYGCTMRMGTDYTTSFSITGVSCKTPGTGTDFKPPLICSLTNGMHSCIVNHSTEACSRTKLHRGAEVLCCERDWANFSQGFATSHSHPRL